MGRRDSRGQGGRCVPADGLMTADGWVDGGTLWSREPVVVVVPTCLPVRLVKGKWCHFTIRVHSLTLVHAVI